MNIEYELILKELKPFKLEDRKTRGDMILTCRLLNGIEGINFYIFFSLNEDHYNTRGHNLKLEAIVEHLNIRKNIFLKRVIEK